MLLYNSIRDYVVLKMDGHLLGLVADVIAAVMASMCISSI